MKIFACWSGDRSRNVAELFKGWIEDVLQGCQVWLSDQSIEKGAFWSAELAESLKEHWFGILFLTQENKTDPWILFEAGGLYKGETKARVVPLLIDLKGAALQPPLSMFQWSTTEKSDMLKLVLAINSNRGDRRLDEARVLRSFAKHWDDFAAKLGEIQQGAAATVAKRNTDEILEELLLLSRNVQTAVSQLAESARTPYYYSLSSLGQGANVAGNPLGAGITMPWAPAPSFLVASKGTSGSSFVNPIYSGDAKTADALVAAAIAKLQELSDGGAKQKGEEAPAG